MKCVCDFRFTKNSKKKKNFALDVALFYVIKIIINVVLGTDHVAILQKNALEKNVIIVRLQRARGVPNFIMSAVCLTFLLLQGVDIKLSIT